MEWYAMYRLGSGEEAFCTFTGSISEDGVRELLAEDEPDSQLIYLVKGTNCQPFGCGCASKK